ncbi:branched-chain amino acid ABC transporter substrate-binding protein [Paraburkholderia caribensis]|uniref:branched-chain amino acid ABC transporter substrate-binding protein n=1 Tax=Paraburkholderia caribensis TaxID=75105 RepID=UPI003AAA9974
MLNLSVAALASITVSSLAVADELVKIGHAGPLTGGSAHLGKDNENGARLAIEEINASGLTINHQKVTLVLDAQDDAADPRQATQVAQRFVDDKVVAVIGHLNSGASIPASKIYSDAGIAQISPSSTNPAYTQQGFKTSFRLVATDAQQGPALAAFAVKALHVKTVAVVDDSTAYGQGLANQFEEGAKALGIKVVSHDATNDKAVDFRSILTKIKGENPDAIMYGGMDSTGGPFVKQARQLGLRARVLSGDGVCTESLAQLAGASADNVICSQVGAAVERMNNGPQFEAKYQKRFGHPIEFDAPFTYDAVHIIVDAMRRANSTEPAKVLAQLASTNYTGITGTTAFDSKGDLRHCVISLYGYKSGKKSLLDDVKM